MINLPKELHIHIFKLLYQLILFDTDKTLVDFMIWDMKGLLFINKKFYETFIEYYKFIDGDNILADIINNRCGSNIINLFLAGKLNVISLHDNQIRQLLEFLPSFGNEEYIHTHYDYYDQCAGGIKLLCTHDHNGDCIYYSNKGLFGLIKIRTFDKDRL